MNQHQRFRLLTCLLVLLLGGLASAQVPIRVATYNVQELGFFASNQWNAAIASLNRVDADIVCVQEVDGNQEVALLPSFATSAGYANSAVSGVSGTLSGNLRNAVLSRYPVVSSTSHSAVSLSGDSNANDITRDIFEVVVQVPGASQVTGFFVIHLKASSGGTNDFRRAVEFIRLRQAIAGFQASYPGAPFFVTGDFNEDVGDGPFNNVFNSLPSGLPSSYDLGSDISFPVIYDPFLDLNSDGVSFAPATQEDSQTLDATRDASGRRLDYLGSASGALLLGDEVYNSARDNGFDDAPIGNWIAKAGLPLAASTSGQASDHFPVFGDFTLPAPQLALYPGSNEDFDIETGVNVTPTQGPGEDQKSAQAGDLLLVRYFSPGGTFDLDPPLLVAQIFSPGSPPNGPLSGLWVTTTGAVILVGGANGLGAPLVIAPVSGNTHAFLLPASLVGNSLMLQALALNSGAQNGFFALSNGHEIQL